MCPRVMRSIAWHPPFGGRVTDGPLRALWGVFWIPAEILSDGHVSEGRNCRPLAIAPDQPGNRSRRTHPPTPPKQKPCCRRPHCSAQQWLISRGWAGYIPPHPAQSQHTNDGAPRTRKRHQQEHRPQRPTESSDPTHHAKGRTGDCPGPRKEPTTRRNVTRGGGGAWVPHFAASTPPRGPCLRGTLDVRRGRPSPPFGPVSPLPSPPPHTPPGPASQAVWAEAQYYGLSDLAQRLWHMQRLVIVGGFTPDALSGTLSATPAAEVYCALDGGWRPAAPLPDGRAEAAACVAGDRLLVFGGCRPEGAQCRALRSAEEFDFSAGRWAPAPALCERRRSCCAVAYEGRVLAIGGRGAGAALASVEAYDAAAREWAPFPGLAHPRAACAAAVVAGRLLVVGGDAGDAQALSSGEEFDSGRRTWVPIPELPVALAACAAAELRGRLVVVGGRNEDGEPVNTALQYDPERREWAVLPSMATTRDSCCLAVVADRLVVVGGGDGKRPLSSVEEYDPALRQWRFLPSMGLPRDSGAAVVVPFHVGLPDP